MQPGEELPVAVVVKFILSYDTDAEQSNWLYGEKKINWLQQYIGQNVS